LFEYGVKRALLSRNPMRAVERVKAVDKPPGIFTPEQLKKLLEAAHGDILPALAIQAFAPLGVGREDSCFRRAALLGVLLLIFAP